MRSRVAVPPDLRDLVEGPTEAAAGTGTGETIGGAGNVRTEARDVSTLRIDFGDRLDDRQIARIIMQVRSSV